MAEFPMMCPHCSKMVIGHTVTEASRALEQHISTRHPYTDAGER